MELQAFETLADWIPSAVTLLVCIAALAALHYVLFVRSPATGGQTTTLRQLLMLVLTAAAVVMVVLVLPIGDTARGQLLTFLGIVSTAAVTLSSTTFLGNAMAGLMLRAVRNFKPGDFLEVGEHFGRVSEHGLLHTEIQTVDRTLTTIPNQYLVTHPVTVVRKSGTMVSATVSLGYEVPRTEIERCLLEAAERCDLTDGFVLIMDLSDFSVSYRLAGFLVDVKYLLTARSRLRASMLDVLHENNIEIVSPVFHNQRRLVADKVFIPRSKRARPPDRKLSVDDVLPEAKIFDKADEAQSQVQLATELEELLERIKAIKAISEKSPDEAAVLEADVELKRLETRKHEIEAAIEEARKVVESDN